ncbi:hypothetical protein P9148_02705 [Bacillus siamensis]|nr:hypothetical protein [Bacillus siamensis]MEC3654026.1 hypothetical protein [Bacillus siamensis]
MLSAVLLTGAAAVAPSASAAWSGWQNQSGCSRMPRLIQEAQQGSFKTATPLKLFNVKTIQNKTGKGTYVIQLDCCSDSGKRNYIGTFESAKCQIK